MTYIITLLISAILYYLVFFKLKEEVCKNGVWTLKGKAKFPIWLWLVGGFMCLTPILNVVAMVVILGACISVEEYHCSGNIRYTLFGLHLLNRI